MPFNRVSYQQVADFNVDAGDTVDLVAPLAASERLVIGKITATLVSDDMAFLYIFKIPPTGSGTEDEDNAIAYGLPLWPGQIFEMEKVVCEGQEGIAVGVIPAPGSGGVPKVVFNAHGDLETGVA